MKRDEWSHIVFLLAGKDVQKAEWIRHNCRVDLIATYWKHYLCEDDQAFDEFQW